MLLSLTGDRNDTRTLPHTLVTMAHSVFPSQHPWSAFVPQSVGRPPATPSPGVVMETLLGEQIHLLRKYLPKACCVLGTRVLCSGWRHPTDVASLSPCFFLQGAWPSHRP